MALFAADGAVIAARMNGESRCGADDTRTAVRTAVGWLLANNIVTLDADWQSKASPFLSLDLPEGWEP